MELLLWLENTSFATSGYVKSNSILGYPTILFLHTLGLATVAGLSTFLNLRVLGFAPHSCPLHVLTPFIRAIWVAFAVTAASGTALLVANAAARAQSPVFLIKLVFVALAVVTLQVMTKRVFRNPLADQSPLPRQAHVLAVLSLLFWVARDDGRTADGVHRLTLARRTEPHGPLAPASRPEPRAGHRLGGRLRPAAARPGPAQRRSAPRRPRGLRPRRPVLAAGVSEWRRRAARARRQVGSGAGDGPCPPRRGAARLDRHAAHRHGSPGSACGRRAGSPVRLAASLEPSCCSPSSRWR